MVVKQTTKMLIIYEKSYHFYRLFLKLEALRCIKLIDKKFMQPNKVKYFSMCVNINVVFYIEILCIRGFDLQSKKYL